MQPLPWSEVGGGKSPRVWEVGCAGATGGSQLDNSSESWEGSLEPAELLLKQGAGVDLGLYELIVRLPKMHKTPGSIPGIT